MSGCPPRRPRRPRRVAAVLAGAMPGVALYVLIRLLFDLAGPAQPAWWGVPLIALGAASAVLGALRATQEADLKSVLGSAAIEQSGLVAVGLGRGAGGARHRPAGGRGAGAGRGAAARRWRRGWRMALLALAAGAVQHGAGTQRAGAAGRAGPRHAPHHARGAGGRGVAGGAAAGRRLPRPVDAVPGGVCRAAHRRAADAGAAGRGRRGDGAGGGAGRRRLRCGWSGWRSSAARARRAPPPRRRPPAHAATRSPRWRRPACCSGSFPGAVLALARPALLLAAGGGLAGGAGALHGRGAGRRAGLRGARVGAAAAAGGRRSAGGLARAQGPAGHRTAPAWDGGADAPPPWLPFGDPLTQVGAAGFAAAAARHARPRAAGRDASRWTGSAAGRHPARAFLVPPARSGRPPSSSARRCACIARCADRAALVQHASVRGALAMALATLVALLLAAALR